MPRRNFPLSKIFPYHVYARANNKEFWYLPIQDVWDIMINELSFVEKKENAKILAFVLMNNHFHLLLQTPKANISKIMYWFMRNTTLKMQKASNRINKIYGGKYQASLINNHDYFLCALKYIYQNPVREKLSNKGSDYPYSSFWYSIRKIKLPFFITKSKLPRSKTFYRWFNQNHSMEDENNIKFALTRNTFKLPKDQKNRKSKSIDLYNH